MALRDLTRDCELCFRPHCPCFATRPLQSSDASVTSSAFTRSCLKNTDRMDSLCLRRRRKAYWVGRTWFNCRCNYAVSSSLVVRMHVVLPQVWQKWRWEKKIPHLQTLLSGDELLWRGESVRKGLKLKLHHNNRGASSPYPYLTIGKVLWYDIVIPSRFLILTGISRGWWHTRHFSKILMLESSWKEMK